MPSAWQSYGNTPDSENLTRHFVHHLASHLASMRTSRQRNTTNTLQSRTRFFMLPRGSRKTLVRACFQHEALCHNVRFTIANGAKTTGRFNSHCFPSRIKGIRVAARKAWFASHSLWIYRPTSTGQLEVGGHISEPCPIIGILTETWGLGGYFH